MDVAGETPWAQLTAGTASRSSTVPKNWQMRPFTPNDRHIASIHVPADMNGVSADPASQLGLAERPDTGGAPRLSILDLFPAEAIINY